METREKTLLRLVHEHRCAAFLADHGADRPETLAALAERAELAPVQLSRLMYGACELGPQVAGRLAHALGVSVARVMTAYHASVAQRAPGREEAR